VKIRIEPVDSSVKAYYERNWESIANCYEIDEFGLPIDAAWYRRRIYKEVIEDYTPKNILDIGCGGGETVLDALQLGIDVNGIEPIENLVRFGQKKIANAGFDEKKITQGDASVISSFEDNSFDLISMLSVIPHVPMKDWFNLHSEIARVLRPGGISVIAYRNELFDLYTANRFTHEFFMSNFYSVNLYSEKLRREIYEELKKFIPHFEQPQIRHTEARDKSFGELVRPKTNPLVHNVYLKQFGMMSESTYFCNIHPFLPNMKLSEIEDFRSVKHKLEIEFYDKWQGYFMAAMFVSVARKLQ
jgi:ubiquinone/menaquinone biosynthesis C-methylase UbiE